MTFGVFEITLLQAFLDFQWVEMALHLARLIGREFRTVMRCALVPLAVAIFMDSMIVFTFAFRALGCLARLILGGFSSIVRRFRWRFSC